MRRWFWAAAVVTGFIVTQAQANYIIIRMTIGGKSQSESEKNQDNRGPGGPIGPGAPGVPGVGGGAGPLAPGAGGRPGVGGPGGGMPGVGGPGMPGAGGPGMPGAGGPGMPGRGGNGGGRPMGPPPGMGGNAGGGSMGGPPMGMGGNGGMGPRGGPGMGGAPSAGSGADFDTFEEVVMAVIEMKDPKGFANEKYQKFGLGLQYKHAYGQTALYNDGMTIQSFIDHTQTPRAMLAARKRVSMASPNKSASEFLGHADTALQHGLIPECEDMIAEAAKLASPSDSEQTKKALDACSKILAALNRPSDGQTTVSQWEKRLAGYGVSYSDKGHYAVFYSPKAIAVPQEVSRRGLMLENHMRAFYLWFALKGHVLPLPQEKLVAVMVADAATLKAQTDALQVKTDADGVFATRDNIAVFSTRRLDEPYLALTKETMAYWSGGWNRDELLKGKEITNRKDVSNTTNTTMKEFYTELYPHAQTLALLEKAMEDEAELAAVTHEGTQQLAIASGLFSRNVILPEWLSYGFASVFETPKGPFAGVDGTARVAFWPTYGAPSWAYMRQFDRWAESKDELTKLDAPADALRRTVTDAYFQRASKKIDMHIDDKLIGTDREKREKEVRRAKEEIARARTLGWALTYYLIKFKLEDFLTLTREMTNMPRDLEMDDQTVLLAFARAMKLATPDGTAVDEKKFAEFADSWFAKMKTEIVPGKEIKLKEPKKPEPTTPGGPGMPGMPGMPGAPGMPGRPGIR